jgi:hypothetical protein
MKKIIKENGIVLAILFGWLFVNFNFLILGEGENYSKAEFYPFTEHTLLYSFDITEFIVYGITPIILFLVIKLIIYGKK